MSLRRSGYTKIDYSAFHYSIKNLVTANNFVERKRK